MQVLAYLRHLLRLRRAELPDTTLGEGGSRAVYFDILRYVFITIPMPVTAVINFALVAISVVLLLVWQVNVMRAHGAADAAQWRAAAAALLRHAAFTAGGLACGLACALSCGAYVSAGMFSVF